MIADAIEPYLGFHPDAELVVALVYPIGTEHKNVLSTIDNYLQQFGYKNNHVRLSPLFDELCLKFGLPWNPPKDQGRLSEYKIEAGNRIRERAGRKDILALVAASIAGDGRSKKSGEGEGRV